MNNVVTLTPPQLDEPDDVTGGVNAASHGEMPNGDAGCRELVVERRARAIKDEQFHLVAQVTQPWQQVHHQVLGTTGAQRCDDMQYPLRNVL